MLSATLFVDKQGNKVSGKLLPELGEELAGVSDYSWGSATLAYLYRQLGVASRGDAYSMSGCLTLLQAWIYEYFPCFRPHVDPFTSDRPRATYWRTPRSPASPERLASYRSRLDVLLADEVTWLPYGSHAHRLCRRTLFVGLIRYRDIVEPYMPDRTLRQLGYVQVLPIPIMVPTHCRRPWESTRYVVKYDVETVWRPWTTFPAVGGLGLDYYERAEVVGSDSVVPDYMYWYIRHSHPRLLRPQEQPQEQPQRFPSSSNGEYWHNRWRTMFADAMQYVPDEDYEEAYAGALALFADWDARLP